MATSSLFQNMCAHFHEPGLGKARTNILKKQFLSKGGRAVDKIDNTVTHVLVANKISREKLLKNLALDSFPDRVSVLSADWLSSCLTHCKLVSTQSYVVPTSTPKSSPIKMATTSAPADELFPKSVTPKEEMEKSMSSSSKRESTSSPTDAKRMKMQDSPSKPYSKRKTKAAADSDSDYVDSAEDDEGSRRLEGDEELGTDTDLGKDCSVSSTKKGMYVCEMPSTLQPENKNKIISDKLEELLKSYENNGDQWRVYTYTKVIQAVKKHPKPITSWEEAKNLPNVGERLADKIWEIVQSGHLRRLDHVGDSEKLLETFKNIWGVGATSARRFVQLGYKSLEDLGQSGILSRVQEIGLQHYDDFNQRIPRSEVKEIEKKVVELAHSIDGRLECTTCGSYRRGRETCGDVDMLITHPDGRAHRGVFLEILKRGHETGFLTDDLLIQENNESQSKYLGVCRLPEEGRKFRRLDIIVVPYSELPCALLYFTGSAHFNRSMRLKAHKLGMSLSEHALLKGVIRQGPTITHKGTVLPVFSEKDVFKCLDIPYCEPHERNWN